MDGFKEKPQSLAFYVFDRRAKQGTVGRNTFPWPGCLLRHAERRQVFISGLSGGRRGGRARLSSPSQAWGAQLPFGCQWLGWSLLIRLEWRVLMEPRPPSICSHYPCNPISFSLSVSLSLPLSLFCSLAFSFLFSLALQGFSLSGGAV